MPTIVPIRLQIQRAISAALEEVNPDNGYEFDLRPDEHGRSRVVRGRLTIGNDEPIPMVTIVEPPMAAVPTSTERQPDNPMRRTDWDLIIQGFAQDDPQNPTDIAYQLEAEVRRRLMQEKRRPGSHPGRARALDILGFGTRIENMTFGSPVIRPSEQLSGHAEFYFVLTLKFSEDMESVIG